jgi:YVTN family beta-propeller protein
MRSRKRPAIELLGALAAASALLVPLSLALAAPLAYITNYADGTVSVIKVARNLVVSTIPVGAGPLTVALHPKRKLAYVTNQLDGTVSVINTRRRRVVATVPVGNYAFGVAVHPDGTRVYVNHFDQQDYPSCVRRQSLPDHWGS